MKKSLLPNLVTDLEAQFSMQTLTFIIHHGKIDIKDFLIYREMMLIINHIQRAFVDTTGIQEIHMGAEFEGTLKATDYLTFNLMFSIGDWKYKGTLQEIYLT